ncbi:MAG TPA: TetR/AcrR family transcriptional regulator [Rhodocyclaceae bacterium]|nr:TetR/AcrR family transcriptional regulator [Zoogloeaceae bacterium]HRD34745.1 TetR/AcrR family transcriptional regulator [Rhodocyclaceae bacterium]
MSEHSAPVSAPSGKVQLTPADWIDAATQVLVDKSIDAVRVDVLAKGLKVTRGSFYWHFQDRDDLLRQLLKSWRDAATEQIINRFERSGADPEALVRELASLPFRGRSAAASASIELAIRAWARRDEMARQVVDEVDAKRLSYVSQCFVALGFTFQEAGMRAFLLYSYMISESLMHGQGTEAQRQARREFVEKLLLGPA